MKIQELQQYFGAAPQCAALAKLLGKTDEGTIHLKGLTGSAASLLFAALDTRIHTTMLFILKDADTAGYFYHDLTQVMGQEGVLFFPSSFKRAVKYGQRQAANALQLAEGLRELGMIQHVNYIGLEDNPFHELSQRQFGKTAGAMLTIDLASKEACFRFLNRLRLIHRATNLFDNRTLAIHPASTIFGLFPEQQLEKMNVRQTTIRLSVGLEAVEDLLEDLQQALEDDL